MPLFVNHDWHLLISLGWVAGSEFTQSKDTHYFKTVDTYFLLFFSKQKTNLLSKKKKVWIWMNNITSFTMDINYITHYVSLRRRNLYISWFYWNWM